MAVYSITYDLIKTKDYEKLFKGIELISGGNWARPTASQWLISSTKTSAQVRDYLLGCIDADDKLFVVEIKPDTWASWNISKNVESWFLKPSI